MSHLTATYSTLHRSIRDTARKALITPYAMRVVLAVYDRGGSACTDVIEGDLGEDGAAVRRALLQLYSRSFAEGVGSIGGPRRKGVRTQVSLTEAGRALAQRVARDFAEAA